MVEGGSGPSFPVVFFDGEREMNIGEVKIHPTLEYKPFQHMLSQKIGISPNQISIYLIFRKKNPNWPFSEDRRRIPITGKVNFALICRQKDCSFLVVLKRSRKSRNRRERMIEGVEFSDNEFSPPMMHSVPENLMLLRRDQPVPFYDQITQPELGVLNDNLRNMRFQSENYQMAMGNRNFNSLNFSWDNGLNQFPIIEPHRIPSLTEIDDRYRVSSTTMMTKNDATEKAFCEECANAENNGNTTSFHPCVNDAVITLFTTRLGPISRPNEPLL
ncbi:hypothetical protein CDL12_28881 [Handroanthus impetiginosus]|uniref:DUF7138 domain-containing protein n=1 Tax=Handroanthus impetiginosus TaxID=429701 RepID=A0A2G9G0G7_9LAMI|nr:hypothetical protein CDL12_28881 [Handroanthus impetiginosus]